MKLNVIITLTANETIKKISHPLIVKGKEKTYIKL